MVDLKDLASKRKDILLAEVAAWLHDWQKCIDMAVASHWRKSLYVEKTKIQEWQQRGKSLKPSEFASVLKVNISDICNHSKLLLKEVVENGKEPSKARNSPHLLIKILGICHSRAHIGKKLKEGENLELSTDWISSPFGWEFMQPDNLLQGLLESKFYLKAFLKNILPKTRKCFYNKIFLVFQKAWGDTRRPINEVTLWDWSSIVAALYKAEIARCVLTNQHRQPKDITWRLLSIRTNGLEYLLSAPSIPDLLARKELLTDAWNRVKKVLEEEYPLGLEVYRDENGPVFVVPDLDNLLGLSNSADNNKTLREYILETFRQGTVKNDPRLAIDGEIILNPDISNAWSGQEDPNTGIFDLPPIGQILKNTPPLQSDPTAITQQWYNLLKPEEICTVCGLRPQGPSTKAKRRKMCDICAKRRRFRSKIWAEGVNLNPEDRFKRGIPETIWIGEVADRNGRIALIVGKFDLTHWLDGTMVRSLAVRTPNDENGHTDDKVAKNPSFARLRRIWETTRRFWQDVAPTDAPPKELQELCSSQNLDLRDLWEGPISLEESLAGRVISERRSRLFLKAKDADKIAEDLEPFHAYKVMVEGRKIDVLWVPPNAQGEGGSTLRGGFWVIENLEYLESNQIFGRKLIKILENGKTYEIYESSEYGRPSRPIAEFELEEVQKGSRYIPLIPILAEPRVFMALVPANKALDIVRAIKTKYEREMGKVRNRLPLHMGVVFAPRMMPLRAVLDAGRRMLTQKSEPKLWCVKDVKKRDAARDTLPERFNEDKNGQFKEWYEITLSRNEREITWYVPALMGDGQTRDNWYPYVFLAQSAEPKDRRPKDRSLYFKAKNPWNPEYSWVVHAGELRECDIVYFTPATFDFIFLESNVMRLRVAYDPSGRGVLDRNRPYLLDEIEDIITAWKELSERLTNTQRISIIQLIESKREEWFMNNYDKSLNDETFWKFCKATLINAEWGTGKKPDEELIQKLTRWAVRGVLHDALQLYHRILKMDMGDNENLREVENET